MLTVTDIAATQFKEIMRSQKMEDASIRVFIQGQCGCGAVHYGMGFDDSTKETDEVLDKDGVKFLVDKDAAPTLDGATIDYRETETSRGFTILNPNAQSGCSCGGH